MSSGGILCYSNAKVICLIPSDKLINVYLAPNVVMITY